MSVGTSALGTLLVQRLDAVLGTTLAQHANLMTGAHADAVSRAAAAARLLGPEAPGSRNERETLERTQLTGPRGAGRGAGQVTGQDDTLQPSGKLRQTSAASTASAPTSLGPAARTILALLSRYPEPAPPASSRAPLWSAPAQTAGAAPGAPAAAGAQAAPVRSGIDGGPVPQAGAMQAAQSLAGPGANGPSAALLARALAQALDGSGLFYESHLAALAFGKRTAAQLQNEPQAQLPAAPRPGEPAAERAAARETDAPRPGEADPQRREAGPAQASSSAPAQQAASPLSASGVHPDAALLVRQQLETLAHQMVAWRGEAWPEAPMSWEVRRNAGENDGGAQAGNQGWSSRLVLDLPTLGRVEANLMLSDNQLLMRLTAPDSADRLQAESASLRDRYSAAGFALTQFSVDAGAAPADEPLRAGDLP